MNNKCERMKKIGDDDQKELKRQIKKAEKLKKMGAKVARRQKSDELSIRMEKSKVRRLKFNL